MAHRVVASDSGHCVSCHGDFSDGDVVIGVVTGVVQDGQIEPKHYDWRHTDCWSPLPERE